MRWTCSYSTAAALVLVALFLPAAGLAQPAADSGPDADDGLFVDSVDVEIVNVDVWVTDKEGKPVYGLQPEDFEVYRNGDRAPITNFYAVEGSRPSDRARRPDPPAADPGVDTSSVVSFTESSAEDAQAEQHRLWLIVYIDNANLDPVERNRILPGVRQFLGENLGADDQAMIVTYDRGLKVRRPFTSDTSKLASTLFEIEEDSGLRAILRRERYDALERLDKLRDPNRGLLLARTYAEELMDNVERTADALERLIDTLAGLPGRKALLHVSSGIPMQAGEEVFQAVGEKWNLHEAYAEIGRHDTARSWERVNRHANAHRVVFYTMDAGGLRGFEFSAAEYGGFLDPKMTKMLNSVVPQNMTASLRLMAIETGGRAIVGRNEILPALVEVAQDFNSFYSLGISSSGVDSGRYYELEVKLKTRPKGVQVRHRAGYRSKNMETRLGETLRSALLYEGQSNPLDVKVRWGKPTPQEDDIYLLPFQLQIPLKDLVLLPLDGKHELRLELYVAAAGVDGDVSNVEKTPIGLRLAPEHVDAARKESFLHTHKMLLGAGRKKVGVAILDRFGQQHSIVTGFLDIGRPDN